MRARLNGLVLAGQKQATADIEEWREGHRGFWESEGTPVTDEDLTVCVWFRLV
jgi:uncharacterized protein YhfF